MGGEEEGGRRRKRKEEGEKAGRRCGSAPGHLEFLC